MVQALMITQLILGLFMIVVVMPQESKQSKSSVFGGEEMTQAYFKPKGKEAFLQKVTKIVAVLFFINAIALLIVTKGQ